MKKPVYFKDEMTRGPFKLMKHLHIFEDVNNRTVMTDIFEFESPLHFISWLTDKFILKTYMTSLLIKRNQVIKQAAETKNPE